MAEDPPPRNVPSLRRFISEPVRVGPFRTRGAVVLLVSATLAFGLGYAARSMVFDHAKAPLVAPSLPLLPSGAAQTIPSAESPRVSSSVPPPHDEPSDGVDLGRLKALEAKPARERSIEESVELARGHQRFAVSDAHALESDLDGKGPPNVRSLARLRELSRDDAVTPDVLAILARHPSAPTDDLLYDVATDQRAAETARLLADDLLAQPAIRNTASKELLLVLDLKNARACEAILNVVKRAKTSADERALPLLHALDHEKGCGKEGKEDCYPCLRDTSLLFEARDAAGGRRFEPVWKSISP